ncbi:Iron hydrogenase 1 [Slackia heliotrinireducens]|uniref:Hydrogenase, Fe-only n=1 Tax=Slackia heliotrinireducens (strain ATCC 29202 / DSM 20476 / NCTC 11029 / RHS 1) TaxID=471855 RepID=C7N6Y7_SLAHD|nr:[FeFe] hydrogenase, group A [Slackia heliotrinireducens]ACV22672.1 hydrogenase, Fe-only [Slackia heliotrinireducens DSM 20476]VEH01252.1 Iron hydrogenase 1 [Slackia heliotrinireducens]
MVKLTIDGKTIEVKDNATILGACKQAGADIPTLCWMKGLNDIGSCRVCVVDCDGELVPSCNTNVREGMVIKTGTPRVVAARKANIETLMESHRGECSSCVRQETCALRALASDFNVGESAYCLPEKGIWDEDFPLIRDASKCIKCMRCVAECSKVQYCSVWEHSGPGPHMNVFVKDGLAIDAAGCALCGQCITHCPTGALTARDDTGKVMKALLDPEVITVVQVAPAVRAAWGEGVGLTREQATPKRMASALRALGFDKVFDTDFAADLTIMEEGSEFVEFLSSDKPRPMFTSCCPGWVRFVKLHYPQFVPQLSSAKSPHQMEGAVVKNTMKAQAEEEGKRLFVVSVMPCVAKKYECDVPQLSTEAGRDVDAVLTVREFDRMLHMFRVDCAALEETDFDNPLGLSTGAGTIFGRTGGVMEAALRSAVFLITGQNPDFSACDTTESTPEKPWISKELDVAGTKVNIAVASGLGNTAKLLDALEAGEVHFDFVEIMACPGGCVGGGGQPIEFNKELALERAANLNALDEADTLRYSHENPDIQKLYADWVGKPLSHVAHEWLHTDQTTWDI